MAVTYRVTLERDGSGAWVTRVPSVPGGHTYGRSIQQALSRTREALGLWVDDADRATLTPEIKIDPELRKATKMVATARARAEATQLEAMRAIREAATRLTDAGLSRRDAATLLGVSHQRIQQLLDAS